MNERLLVPINDSDPARAALEDATELFDPGEIVLLHVLEMDELTHGAAGAAAGSLRDEREEEAEELFEDARQRIGDEVSVETILKTGQPSTVIVEAADSGDIDHIVMGSHGRSGISGLLVGSVAKNVIESSPVSVTISRP
ncbi:universal stress protein [Natronococcus occultus]|uniref:Universal stress protein UspA-like protein n=1 Tax=Natronococcus occultus SP4 TaxID=694430 RepID=L0K4P8_9EURY|nr:universal stress protein [Natronococcus occultus]AGB39319.1 universal stress protein UspA-like protein [Natronococcus occultus SP4]